jgi:hypothetical protein
MIRSTLTTDFPTIPDMGAVTNTALNQAVKSSRVQRTYARAIAEPPKSAKRPPMAKMTKKQRGYVFANIDLPHQRTGGIVDKCRLLVIRAGDGSTVVLANKSSKARHVLGDMRGRGQQQFLRDNQWTPAIEVKRETFTVIIEEMRRGFTPAFRDAMRVTGGVR